jgi:putative hydrolase of the HAD superfamily
MNRSPIRNVIFDFGGVLVRWKPEEIITGFYPDEDRRARLRQTVFQHPDWVDMDRGTLSEAAAIERFSARMQRPAAEMRGLMQTVRESLTPMEETVALLETLAERGVPLYGLSNMSTETFAHLRSRYGHWDRFRGIVISAEVKMVKPDPEIFDYIARRYGLLPEETVFIDDHPPNIESARRHGFRAIRFADAHQCRAELDEHLVTAPTL